METFHLNSEFDWNYLPVDEINEEVFCRHCQRTIEEWAYFEDGIGFSCEACAEALAERVVPEAERFAKEHCKVTFRPQPYNPAYEFRPTPEEYDAGNKEAYTPNSYETMCRHACTNYDELIQNLSKDRIEDRVYYWAVRVRINELVEDLILDLETESDDTSVDAASAP